MTLSEALRDAAKWLEAWRHTEWLMKSEHTGIVNMICQAEKAADRLEELEAHIETCHVRLANCVCNPPAWRGAR